jgi:hypothetical protein
MSNMNHKREESCMTPDEGDSAAGGILAAGILAAGGDPIAAYVTDLSRRLTSGIARTFPDRAAQICAEAEDHLRTAAADLVAAGTAEQEAQLTAIAAFGEARTVARAHRPAAASVIAATALAAVSLAGAYALLAVIASGALLLRWALTPVQVQESAAVPAGQAQAPAVSVTHAPGLDALRYLGTRMDQFLACLILAGLVAAAVWLIRLLPAVRNRIVPVPSFVPPAATVLMAALAIALNGILTGSFMMRHASSLIVMAGMQVPQGAVLAAATMAVGCALWWAVPRPRRATTTSKAFTSGRR